MVFHNTIELDGLMILALVLFLLACVVLMGRRLSQLEAKNQVMLTQIEILLRAVTTRQNKVGNNVRTDGLPRVERAKTQGSHYKTTTDNPGRQSEVKSSRRDGSRD